jgi:putative glutamine amidotransferase
MYKNRIGITQKLIKHPEYDETLTCLDNNWFNLITKINALPIPIPMTIGIDSRDIIKSLNLDGLIFSGGNSLAELEDGSYESRELSEKRDQFEFDLLKAAINLKYPVIGVCRGMQLINSYFNGGFKKVSGHVSTRHKIYKNSNQNIKIYHNNVNSFHNFGIPYDGLGTGLAVLAEDKDRNIEAFCHKQHKILGIMWHPEREIPQNKLDQDLIRHHFNL